MTCLQLSVEVSIPEEVTERQIIEIAGECVPPGVDTDGMELDEALSWAFSNDHGCFQLSTLGITWQSVPTGNVEPRKEAA